MINQLQDLTPGDQGRFGVKAVSLGLLMQQDIRVPPGYALSIDACDKVMKSCGAAELLDNILASTDQIRDRIRDSKPQDWELETIEPVWQRLTAGGRKIAVRSSSILEDAADASFAGIFSSSTGLVELDEVFVAIRECYVSLYSDEAISACLRSGKDLKSAAMAVILQEYIEGSPSGVLFTSDAVAMDDTHMVVNAVDGPCSDMVGGNADVQLIRINRDTGDKALARDTSTAMRRILTDGQAGLLMTAGTEIERALEPRQDIEWTFTGDTLWIVQARPITTFKEKIDPKTWDTHDGKVWDLEAYSQALTPLGQEMVATSFEGSRAGSVETGNTSVAADYVARNGYFYVRPHEIPNQEANRETWARYVAQQHAKRKNIFEDILLPQIVEWQARLDSYVERVLKPDEIAEFLQQSLEYTHWVSAIHWKAVWGTCYLVGCRGGQTFADEYQQLLEPFSSGDITDLVYSPTELSATRRSLVAMAAMVQESPVLRQVFDRHSSNDVVFAHLQTLSEGGVLLKEIESLFDRCWRYQTGTWREPVAPTIFEKKATLLGWIRPYLAVVTRDVDAASVDASKRKTAVIRSIESELSASAKEQFRIALSLAEKAYRCRDDHAHFIDCTSRSYPRMAASRAGEYMLKVGYLASASDVWLMNSDEIVSLLIGDQDVLRAEDLEQRRLEHNRNLATLPPMAIGTAQASQSDDYAESITSTEPTTGHLVLPGISGLATVVQGTAVVYSGDNLLLTEPAILVLPDVRSLDVVAYLDRLVGVIVETGSPYSHLGIIARELSIPCLFGVDGATQMLCSGDRLEIDGVRGQVTRL